MLKYGLEYDHSFSHEDCQCYYLRTGDTWIPIDYDKQPEHWMKPLERGKMTGIVEIPSNWYLDDLPPMMFIKASPNSHGWVNPKDVEELWLDHFNYFYREYDEFVFPVTVSFRCLSDVAKPRLTFGQIHPDACGECRETATNPTHTCLPFAHQATHMRC